MLVNCVDNFFWNYFSTMTTVNIFFFGSLPYRCKRLKTSHFARSCMSAGGCFSTTYKPPFQHPRAENLSSIVPSEKWIKLAKTFYKFMHKYFGILNPCSLSESYYFYGFFRKKVIISYHHFFIHLINTFSPLFNTSAPWWVVCVTAEKRYAPPTQNRFCLAITARTASDEEQQGADPCPPLVSC